jgi:hypothetical protein
MKARYLLAIVFLVIASCKKEAARLTHDLQGKWELASADDAWFGHREFVPGNGNTFSFNGSAYLRKVKTADTAYQYSGTFKIYTGRPCDFANEQTLINFDNDVEASSFSLSNEKLTIGTTECIADGATSTFKRIQ